MKSNIMMYDINVKEGGIDMRLEEIPSQTE